MFLIRFSQVLPRFGRFRRIFRRTSSYHLGPLATSLAQLLILTACAVISVDFLYRNSRKFVALSSSSAVIVSFVAVMAIIGTHGYLPVNFGTPGLVLTKDAPPRKTYVYRVDVPVAAQWISLSVAPFEILHDSHSNFNTLCIQMT